VPGNSAVIFTASCVWDPRTSHAIESVDFGTGKIHSTSLCPSDPWVEDVPCVLLAANGSDPDMEKLRQRVKFGWPMSARVLYGERAKVRDALENAGPPPRVSTPVPNRGGGTSRSYLPTATPTPKGVRYVPPGSLFPDYAATYSLPLVGAPMKAGSTQTWDVGVRNGSNKTWPANGPFRLSYQWYQNRMHVNVEERRSPMPKDVATFETGVVHATFVVPPKPGTYLLRWDMIEDVVLDPRRRARGADRRRRAVGGTESRPARKKRRSVAAPAPK
jgi:hypothetical protein